MAVKGDSSLNFSGQFDISQIIENQQKVIQGFADLKKAAESSAPTSDNGSALRQQNIATQNALRDSRLEIEKLKREEQQLINQQAALGVSTAELTQRITANRLAQQELRMQTQAARLAQTAANGSYREAQLRLTALGREIREAAGGFRALGSEQQARIAEYRQLNAELTEFDRRLGNNQRNVGNYSSAIGGIGNAITGLAAGYLSAYAAIGAVSKIVSKNAEISDSLADVRRTAGLTEEEANNLLETFKKFDTRTGLKSLLDIAGIGGQIGISKDQLEGFTRSIDQLSIVLSNEIPGGADAVATALGKINGVFDTQKRENLTVEESFNKTGSAILGLGQAGLATGEFLVDFTQRVAGSAKQAGISLPVMLAYGSVLEEAGKSAEVAGSSVNRLIASLSVNREKFFAIAKLADANLTLKEFTRTINTDANAALQLFFKGLNAGNPSQTAFADRLATIPRLAGETRSSIIALAQSQEKLSEKINISTADYENANKTTEQAAIKNDTLAASIDKINKTFENATTSGAIGKFFKSIVDGANYALQAVEDFFQALSTSQEKADYDLVKANEGGFVIPSDDPKERQALEEARARVKARGTASLMEEINARGFSSADILAAGKDEIEIRKILTGEILKQAEAQRRLSYNLAYIKDPKNVGAPLDAQIAKTNKLREAYAQQAAVVDRLKSKLPALKQAQTDVAGVSVTKGDGGLKRQRALQAEIDKYNAESRAKQLTQDEKELAELDIKLAAIKQKIKDFNADPKNTFKVNSAGIEASYQRYRDEILAKQTIERTKITIDAQKQLFTQYEEYKTQFGQEEADKRFSEDLKGYKTYVEYVKSLLPADTDKSVTANKLRDLINKDVLPKAQTEDKKLQQRRYDDAYQSALTYYQKVSLVNEEFETKKAALGEKVSQEQLDVLLRERDERKKILNQENADREAGYVKLLENLDAMTRGEAIKAIEKAKADYTKQYEAKLITAEYYTEKINQLNSKEDELNGSNIFKGISNAIARYKEAKKAFNVSGSKDDAVAVLDAKAKMLNKVADGADNAAAGVEGVAEVFDKLGVGGEELQNTLKQISGVLSGAGTLAKGIASGDVASIISGSVKLITSAVDLFNFKDKRIAKQIKQYQADLAALGKSYAQLERDVQNAAGTDIYTDQNAQISNLLQQQQKLIQIRDAESEKKKKDQGKIDDLNNQIDDIPNKIADIQNSISQNLIQGTFRDLSTSLADALVGAFQAGEDGIAAMDKSLDAFIANAIKGGLRIALLEKPIKAFTDDLAAYAKANNNSIIGFDFEKYKNQLNDAGKLFNDALKNSQEFFTTVDTSGQTNTLQGSIKASLTEETGSILAGAFNGMRLSLVNIETILKPMGSLQLNMFNLAQANLSEVMNIQMNTFRTANNTDQLSRLARVESALVSIDNKMNNNLNALQGTGSI